MSDLPILSQNDKWLKLVIAVWNQGLSKILYIALVLWSVSIALDIFKFLVTLA